ncbi:hypothetical protein ACFVTJ_13690 [Agrobacterium sp. NPDC058088]|uniref:hypothetical protein n=1 Tax=Agrobacterium sp. NPDC058088 TaxID=3346335 RepID=UPI0036DAEF11
MRWKALTESDHRILYLSLNTPPDLPDFFSRRPGKRRAMGVPKTVFTPRKCPWRLTKNVQRTNFGEIDMKFGLLDTYHPDKFV